MRTEYEKGIVNKVTKADGTTVFYAFVDKIDYRYADLPRWVQALPDKALLIINPDLHDGQVVIPEHVQTKGDLRTELMIDSFYEFGRDK